VNDFIRSQMIHFRSNATSERGHYHAVNIKDLKFDNHINCHRDTDASFLSKRREKKIRRSCVRCVRSSYIYRDDLSAMKTYIYSHDTIKSFFSIVLNE